MRRIRLAALLAFLSLVIAGSATTPALAAPPTPTSFRLASNGSGNTSLRVQWTWRAGIASYDLQVATDSSFAHLVKQQSVAGSSSSPSGGVVAVTVSGLKNATTFKLRVRARTSGVTSAWSATLSASTTVHWPGVLGGVTASPGPGVGQITFRWTSDGTYTTSFHVETALTMWSLANPDLPRYGRQHTVFKVGSTKRSLTLSAAQVTAAGAGVSTGNHFYYRVLALNWGTAGHHVRQSALLGVRPKPGAPASSGTGIRVASFNVLTAKSTSHPWLQRANDVAQQIVAVNPAIAALQELTPGRADGKSGSTAGHARQTDSLLSALGRNGGGKYKLVRTTPYVSPGTVTGTQGARILYDKTKYQLLTSCPNSSSGGNYSSSCSIKLPIASGESESARRWAAYAEFRNRTTGKRFFFVSAHLSWTSSTNHTTRQRFNTLRRNQMATITSLIDQRNTAHEQVIVAGDMNSWQSNPYGNAPHDYLVQHGYYDASAAVTAVNLKYPTANHFQTTLQASAQSYAAQIDMIFVKGSTGAVRFQNVMKVTDSSRPSDHNLVYADLVL
jgi:endonuclease/exonuclease/phosphatase family metal-dependent hydrolase